MAKYAGVDLSYAQTDVDYKALGKAKIRGKPLKFAMLRIGHGLKKDTMFDEHYKGCKAAGMRFWVDSLNTPISIALTKFASPFSTSRRLASRLSR